MAGGPPERQRFADIRPRSLSRFRLELIREPDERFQVKGRIEVEGLAALAHEVLRGFDREAVGAIYLDSAGRPIGYTVAYVGTLSRTAVEPRGLLVPGLLANAARLVAFHNHPGGTENPSGDDILFTRRLAEAGDTVGLAVVDHLILGEEPRFVSLRSRGLL
jgi:DNA repair protein RadC